MILHGNAINNNVWPTTHIRQMIKECLLLKERLVWYREKNVTITSYALCNKVSLFHGFYIWEISSVNIIFEIHRILAISS